MSSVVSHVATTRFFFSKCVVACLRVCMLIFPRKGRIYVRMHAINICFGKSRQTPHPHNTLFDRLANVSYLTDDELMKLKRKKCQFICYCSGQVASEKKFLLKHIEVIIRFYAQMQN